MGNDAAIRAFLIGSEDADMQSTHHSLRNCGGINVVGQADSTAEAEMAAAELSPDIFLVLADSLASEMGGVAALRRIVEARPFTPVVIITRSAPRYLVPATKAGAAGILPPEANFAELLPAICETRPRTASYPLLAG